LHRFDTDHECDRQTDRQTPKRLQRRAKHSAFERKNELNQTLKSCNPMSLNSNSTRLFCSELNHEKMN